MTAQELREIQTASVRKIDVGASVEAALDKIRSLAANIPELRFCDFDARNFVKITWEFLFWNGLSKSPECEDFMERIRSLGFGISIIDGGGADAISYEPFFRISW